MGEDRVPRDHWSAFLYTLPADARHRRLALGALVVSVAIFLVAAPFARVPLPQVPAFIPIYQSALVTNDVITAVLLLGQYSFLRARALLALASGYLFCAFMAGAHALSFPGLFSPAGALGAGSQTTAWLYFIWHGGFPLFILAYLYLRKQPLTWVSSSGAPPTPARGSVIAAIAGTLALCVAAVLLTTIGHDALPVIMRGNQDDSGKLLVAAGTWALSLLALALLWRRSNHTVLDLWLMVSLVAWLFDVALASVLNAGRFDLGFYSGRVYGLLASSFVLLVLLFENVRLYTDLANAHERARHRSAELEEARNTADAAAQAKSEFLAAMSHEIRTPMNGVIGMIDVLARSSLKAHQVAMVDLMRESAHSLLTIIDDILDFSKIEAGRLDIESEPLAISDVVERVCAMLNRLAEKQKVELTLFTDPQLPDEVLGDALRLRQVLVNLINNAIKFSGRGSTTGRVAVRAMLTGSDTDRVVVEFQVIDNGIGMSEATIASLFNAFTQADASTTRRFGGTGLGLAISANLARLMGGSIQVQSVPGGGSTFAARLPFALSAPRRGDPKTASLVEGLSCLVVGNGDTLSGDLVAYLASAGAQVRQVPDLVAAAALVPTLPADLWVWVVNTPAEKAVPLETLREVARSNASADTRFVVISHGPHRYPGQFDADRVSVDGNVLTRGALLRAVAIAAGRARPADDQPEEKVLRSPAAPVALSREEARRQGRLLLVAEDNEMNQRVIMQQLALLGFAADLTGDGAHALQLWRSGDYGLVITDLHMPGMDGYQLAAAIRGDEAARLTPVRIPIVALTANALKGEAERCMSVGMNDYMSKPAPLTDLQALLEKWLPAARAMAPPIPVDVQALRAQVGDDPLVIAEFLSDFRISARQLAQDIAQAFSAQDAKALASATHKLKSAARAVGAHLLGEMCAEMESMGGSGQLEALAPTFERFREELQAVEAHLEAVLPDAAQRGEP